MGAFASRRAVLGAAVALPSIAAVAALPGLAHAAEPEAELLAIGRQADVLLPLVHDNDRLQARLAVQRDELCSGLTYEGRDLERRFKIEDDTGFSAAVDEGDALSIRFMALMERAADRQATTAAGLKVKAKMALYFVPDPNESWGAVALKSLVEDVLALGAV